MRRLIVFLRAVAHSRVSLGLSVGGGALVLALTTCAALGLPASAGAVASTAPTPPMGLSLLGSSAPSLQATFVGSTVAADEDQLGNAVAVSGDTAVVGAPYYGDSSATPAQEFRGRVYVYVRSGAAWTQQQVLNYPGTQDDSYFGCSVAIDGDTIVVGAYGDGGTSGSVFVFTRSAGVWSLEATIARPYESEFGRAVALSGDTMLVGTYYASAGDGDVFVYQRSGSDWTQQAHLTASDAKVGDCFGWAVALSGDTAVIGAPFHGGTFPDGPGAAYVFTRSGTTWTQRCEVDGTGADDNLGRSVAVGGQMALVGAPMVGRVDVLGEKVVGDPTSWASQSDLTGGDWGDFFGWAVALSGNTALVGADRHVTGGLTWAGAAYGFTYDAGVWSQPAEFAAPSPVAGGQFGYALGLDGTTALVGAPDPNDHSKGHAYVYVLGGSHDDSLSALGVSASSLSPAFSPTTLSYSDSVANSVTAITVSATTDDSNATYALQVGGVTVTNPIALNVGANTIDVIVTAQDGVTTQTYALTVTRAALISPHLTLKLSGLKGGALKLGKRLTAKGTVTPTSLAGSKVTLTVQRKVGGKWRKVKTMTAAIGAGGTYSCKYKPAKKGSYRLRATIAKTATHTAARTTWRTFKVK